MAKIPLKELITEEMIDSLPEHHKFLMQSFLSVQDNLTKAIPEIDTKESDGLKYAFITATILNLVVNNNLCIDCLLNNLEEASVACIEDNILNFHREIEQEYPDLNTFNPTGNAH